jgi:hypothetical protein
MTSRIIFETPAGSPLQFKIEMNSEADLVVYNPSDWLKLMRFGLQVSGDYWIDYYLPLRFNNYARAMGMYQGKQNGTPLVDSGYLRQNVLGASHADVFVTRNVQRIDLVIPIPNTPQYLMRKDDNGNLHDSYFSYACNPVVLNTLSSITSEELERMARKAAETIEEALAGVVVSKSRTVTIEGMAVSQSIARLNKTQRYELRKKGIEHAFSHKHGFSLKRQNSIIPKKVA